MATSTRTRKPRPVASPAVATLAELPAGPQLAAALAGLDLRALSGFETVLVVKAWHRLNNHTRGMMLAAVGELMLRKDPEYGRVDPDEPPPSGGSAYPPDEVGVSELRTALWLTRRSANKLCGLAGDLMVRLPQVRDAMIAGMLDQARATIFSVWTGDLSDRHAQAVVQTLLPTAAQLTTAQLIERIQKAAIELDPEWARRRYENGLKARDVTGTIYPDGTADLTGTRLPADEVAAACDRIDALAQRVKQAGHWWPLRWIRADIFLGRNSKYVGYSDDELEALLLATMPPQPTPHDPEPTPGESTVDPQPQAADPNTRPDQPEADRPQSPPNPQRPTGPENPGGPDPDGPKDSASGPGRPDGPEEPPSGMSPAGAGPDRPDSPRSGPENPGGPDDLDGPEEPPSGMSPAGAGPDRPDSPRSGPENPGGPDRPDGPTDAASGPDHPDGPEDAPSGVVAASAAAADPGGSPESTMDSAERRPGAGSCRAGGGVSRRRGRRGLRLLAGLGTIAGVDRRPAELLGHGFLHAELARRIAAAPAAAWYVAVTDPDGTPRHIGPIRRRPTMPCADTPTLGASGVEIWLQVTATDLATLNQHPPPGWEQIIDSLATRIAHGVGGPPNGDPTDRLPNDALRRWIHIRDRRCVFPGCRIAPHRTDADHTREYANGGPTLDTNLGSTCGPDHDLRHTHGWTVQQPTPGRFVWTSPLGHVYPRLAPPGPDQALPPMPEPTRPEDDWFHHHPNTGVEDDGPDSCKTVIPPPPPPRPAPPPQPAPRPTPHDPDEPPF